VLDPFVGGGSVAAAALVLGRKVTGIEIEKKHIEITRRRIEEVLQTVRGIASRWAG
jgi:DNA modification methylase